MAEVHHRSEVRPRRPRIRGLRPAHRPEDRPGQDDRERELRRALGHHLHLPLENSLSQEPTQIANVGPDATRNRVIVQSLRKMSIPPPAVKSYASGFRTP